MSLDWMSAYLRAGGFPDTHQNRSLLASWQRYEGGHTNNSARWNYMNTTQNMPGSRSINSVGVKAYKSLAQGARAWAQTLHNGRYGDLAHGLASGDPYKANVVSGLSTWLSGSATSRAGQQYASRVLGTHVAAPPPAPGAPSTSLGVPGAPRTTRGPGGVRMQLSAPFDLRAAGIKEMQQIASGEKPTDAFSFLTQSILNAQNTPQRMRSVGNVPGQLVTQSEHAVGVKPGSWKKWFALAPGADRPGVQTHQDVEEFVGALGRRARQRLTIGTGTNHNQMTVNGNVSDHWSGHAADIPSSGAALTRLGRQALIQAGMPRKQALAQKGGLFNVGPYQIIFNTTEGGNHWNHLHVGIHHR